MTLKVLLAVKLEYFKLQQLCVHVEFDRKLETLKSWNVIELTATPSTAAVKPVDIENVSPAKCNSILKVYLGAPPW